MAESRKVLLPSEVADMFGVDPKTVTRWARADKIPYFITPGGHRRFYEDEIKKLLESKGGKNNGAVAAEQ